jgi:hypothetical protein
VAEWNAAYSLEAAVERVEKAKQSRVDMPRSVSCVCVCVCVCVQQARQARTCLVELHCVCVLMCVHVCVCVCARACAHVVSVL